VIEPKEPVTAEPTLAAAEAWTPARTPVTVLVSPASTSVSLVSTLPVGFVPEVPLLTPPASIALTDRGDRDIASREGVGGCPVVNGEADSSRGSRCVAGVLIRDRAKGGLIVGYCC
jgi:hypothetical protein